MTAVPFRAGVLGACLGGLGFGLLPASPREPPEPLQELPDPLPFASAVKDPVFAILLGLLDADRYGRLSREHLGREMGRLGTTTRLPYEKVARVSRRSLEPGRVSEITLEFLGPVKVPVPYSILGYHPGHVLASPTCRLREWKLGALALGPLGERFDDVRLLAVEEGELDVDIDGLVDLLAGSALDDSRLTGLAVLRHLGRRLGVAFGYNPDGRARYGVFDFAADKVLIPVPKALKGVPGDLRRRSETMRGAAYLPPFKAAP
jgi:hypothetical protein